MHDFYDDMKKANLHIVEEIFSEYTDEELKHLLVSSTELTNSLRQIAEFLEDPLVSHEED